jgi:diguanylate cyclase (GGDEF)-like protein
MEPVKPARPRLESSLGSAWRWLAAPLIPSHSARGRRTHLLAWVLLTLLAMTLVSVLLVPYGTPSSPIERTRYIPFILILDLLLAIAYLLNASGRYPVAAGLTILSTVSAQWGALLIDPAILKGDFIPLAYAALTVFLCSLLLSPLTTALLALLQLAGYALIAAADPVSSKLNWASLLIFLLFASALSILASSISQYNLAEIERQTRRLEESEAGLRELSVRDYLTQLFNRRYLEESLQREIQRSARARHTIGIIVFDLDQFKEVNDRWGHAAGDLLLLRIGDLSRRLIRGGDIACRYGGDEFVLMLPEAASHVTRLRAERLCQSVREARLDYMGNPLGIMTVSVGMATYPQDGATAADLLRAADTAMYRAKAAGRDRVMASVRERAAHKGIL